MAVNMASSTSVLALAATLSLALGNVNMLTKDNKVVIDADDVLVQRNWSTGSTSQSFVDMAENMISIQKRLDQNVEALATIEKRHNESLANLIDQNAEDVAALKDVLDAKSRSSCQASDDILVPFLMDKAQYAHGLATSPVLFNAKTFVDGVCEFTGVVKQCPAKEHGSFLLELSPPLSDENPTEFLYRFAHCVDGQEAHKDSVCTKNKDDTLTCVCKPGYKGDGYSCTSPPGCSADAKFKFKVDDDLWVCSDGGKTLTGTAYEKTWTRLTNQCNQDADFHLPGVRPMTKRGLPDKTKWDAAGRYMKANDHRYFITGQAVRDCYWTDNVRNFPCSGVGFIQTTDTFASSNWVSFMDGNGAEKRKWPNAIRSQWDEGIASICAKMDNIPGAYKYGNEEIGYQWRLK